MNSMALSKFFDGYLPIFSKINYLNSLSLLIFTFSISIAVVIVYLLEKKKKKIGRGGRGGAVSGC